MTEPKKDSRFSDSEDDTISLLALGNVILRWRRTIAGLALVGMVIGIAIGLTKTRVYVSSAIFLPQGAEASSSGLVAAASQFGIRVPTNSSVWGPPLYVALLRSRTLLEPIAMDTITVAEEQGHRVPLMQLLDVKGQTREKRADFAVRKLRGMITSEEVKPINAVQLTVTTRWPSVSMGLAERMVRSVNQFNLETRRSQATAERQFVEARSVEAEAALREAENRLQGFLQRNRAINGSPELAFDRDRLQREVTLRQQVYTSMLENREEARMREVRDTPVITVLEAPRLPVTPEARGTVSKGILGAFAGAVVALILAFFAEGLAGARYRPSQDAREFFQLVDEVTPRFLKRHVR